jgi:hypothetical protein
MANIAICSRPWQTPGVLTASERIFFIHPL